MCTAKIEEQLKTCNNCSHNNGPIGKICEDCIELSLDGNKYALWYNSNKIIKEETKNV